MYYILICWFILQKEYFSCQNDVVKLFSENLQNWLILLPDRQVRSKGVILSSESLLH